MRHISVIIVQLLLAAWLFCACHDQKSEAQKLFSQGISMMEERNWNDAGEKLLHSLKVQDEEQPTALLAKTYASLSRVYWEQDFFRKSTEYAQKGLRVSLQLSDDTLRMRLLTRLASCYYLSGEHDSAYICYRQVLEKAQRLNDSSAVHNAYNNIGAVYISKEEPAKALECFSKGWAYGKQNQKKRFHYYYNRSRCFANMQQWDSCIVACREAMDNVQDNDLEGKLKLYRRLYVAAKNQGHLQMACVFADSCYTTTDSYWNLRRQDDLKDLTEQYQKERYETSLKLQRTYWMLAVLMILAVTGIIIYAIAQRNKRRVLALQKRLEDLKVQIYREENVVTEEPTATAPEDDEEERQRRLRVLYRQQLSVARDLLRTKPTYSRLCQLRYRTDHNYLADAERLPLIDSVVETFVEPLQNLRRIFPELTEDECIYAILTFVGCSNATISMLTKTTEATLRKRRSRFKQKVAEELFIFLTNGK